MPIIKTYIVPHPPVIIPEIGKGSESNIQHTINAYNEVAKDIAKIKPDTIIISSPHSIMYADYFHISPGIKAFGDFKQFGNNEVNIKVDYDKKLVNRISKRAKEVNLPIGIIGEKEPLIDHGTLVPLYFIKQYYNNFKIIRISSSGMPLIDHYEVGKMINSIISNNQKVIWVASGDLSHKLKKDGPYGLAEEGKIFDKQLIDILSKGDFSKLLNFNTDLRYKAAECGLGSFTMMLGAFDGYNTKSKLLSYEGPFGVGYAVASFEKMEYNKSREYSRLYHSKEINMMKSIRENEDEYVSLARKSLEFFIMNHKQLELPLNLSKALLRNKAGVFVSLHIDNVLRGCIGTISPTTNSVAEEIIQNAVSAGTRDYRFSKVREKELLRIEYSVDILSPAEKIESKEQLDILKYGVIVSNGYKSGLLLPNIEGISNVEEQVRIAKRKAGINASETFQLERFEVIRHH